MINSFSGDYRFLSNFFPAEVVMDGVTYPSVEHAYQAAKTLDPVVRESIRSKATAGAAKKAGKAIMVRADWDLVKLAVMEDLVRQKFTSRADLRDMLMTTVGHELIEGNWWGDTYWGVCKGKGENNLGRILMKIRIELFVP